MQCIKTRIEWLKRIIAALTGTCIFGDAVTFINKDCRVLFGDIFIVPFLGPALGWTAMCSPGWGNLVAIDWNDLPVGREFDGKFLKNFKSPPYALPPPPCRLNIDRCINTIFWKNKKQKKKKQQKWKLLTWCFCFCFFFYCLFASRAIWKPFYQRLRFWVVLTVRVRLKILNVDSTASKWL